VQAISSLQPKQARSFARRATILAVATALIEERGSERVAMSDIAAGAKVSIGSLYQYFPDKTHILRALAVASLEAIHLSLKAQFADVTCREDGLRCFSDALDAYYAEFMNRPILRDLWAGTQADAMLHDINIVDSRANGGVVYNALEQFVPVKQRDTFKTSCFLLAHLTGATVFLAVQSTPEEGRALVERFKQITLREISAFFDAGA
jgi:AcrR family transcriptional regulator